MPLPSTMTPIATNTLTSNTTNIIFNNIPQTYTDLLLVCSFKNTGSVDMLLRFNSNSTNNYSYTSLYGTGSSAGSMRGSNTTVIVADPGALGFGTEWSNGVINIMNYASSSVFKTALCRFNGPTVVTGENVGVWRNTNAITYIDFFSSSANSIATGSTFTLYGIKAA